MRMEIKRREQIGGEREGEQLNRCRREIKRRRHRKKRRQNREKMLASKDIEKRKK